MRTHARRPALRRTAALGALCAALALPATAGAPAAAGPGPGHFSSDNVAWLTVIPKHSGTSGARLLDGYLYVTDPRGLTIYDVRQPATPVEVGSVRVYQSSATSSQEDPDTNGRILLLDSMEVEQGRTSHQLLVIDVSDKTAPRVVGRLPGVADHTWTCVADCTYAYGRTGYIVDLRDPAQPKGAGNWKSIAGISPGYTHDFTEVRPGRLMSSGQPSIYLDTTDPAAPRLLTRVNTKFSTLGYHSNHWPRGATDGLMLMATEIGVGAAGGDCQGDGIIATYDATAVRGSDEHEADTGVWPAADFTKLHQWRVSGRGIYADGNAPFHVTYCSHWFDVHPRWDDGGYLAMGYYEWGTRFLQVDTAGKFSEVGWFQPVGGRTSAAYWASDEIVYVLDYRRGLDVLRFTPPAG